MKAEIFVQEAMLFYKQIFTCPSAQKSNHIMDGEGKGM